MDHLSLRTKILAGSICLVLALGLAVMLSVRASLPEKIRTELHKRGESLARHFAVMSVEPLMAGNMRSLRRMANRFKASEEDVAYVFAVKDGRVLASTFDAGLPEGLLQANAPVAGQAPSVETLKTQFGTIYDVAVPVDGLEGVTVRLGMSEQPVSAAVSEMSRMFVSIIALVLALGIVAASAFAIRTTRPITKLTEAVRAVEGGDLLRKVDIKSGDEVGHLAQAFNAMTGSLNQSHQDLKRANDRLRLFSEAMESAVDGIQITDLGGLITYSNMAVEEIYGYSAEELLGKHVSSMNADPTFAEKEIIPAIQKRGRWEGELRVKRKSGETFPVWLRASLILDSKGDPVAMVGVIRDITGRKIVEEALRRAYEDWRTTFDSISDFVSVHDREFRIVKANKALADFLGRRQEDVIGLRCYEVIHKDTQPIQSCPHAQMLMTKEPVTEEMMDSKLGVPLLVTASPILDDSGEVVASVHIARDISAFKRMEDDLRASLAEKEMLLKEIHHRIKNNLTVITSLLKLQSKQVADEACRGVLREVQNRVNSMSLIHDRLYRSADFRNVDFSDYIRSLAVQLFRSYSVDASKVLLRIDVPQVTLDIDTIIPCGLILNELVSNVLKHAFPEGRKGEVFIGFSEKDGQCELTVRDTGIGIPAEVDPMRADTLGMQLIRSLAAQIGGTMELKRDGGTEVTVRFMIKGSPA